MSEHIRVISIGLFSYKGRILVCEFTDSVKNELAARPLGGGVEFGETSAEALEREIQEELDQDIGSLELLGVLENTFEYEGKPGHEIVFVYDAEFKDASVYEKEALKMVEGDMEHVAVWRSLDYLKSKLHLVPDGLYELIRDQNL